MKWKIRAMLSFLGAAVLLSGCATKGFVREQVGTSESKLAERADSTDAKLRETSDRTASNTQALESTGQRLTSLDAKVSEVDTKVGTVAADAKKDTAAVAQSQKDSESVFNQRFANRNKYAQLQTKSIYFDFNKSDL